MFVSLPPSTWLKPETNKSKCLQGKATVRAGSQILYRRAKTLAHSAYLRPHKNTHKKVEPEGVVEPLLQLKPALTKHTHTHAVFRDSDLCRGSTKARLMSNLWDQIYLCCGKDLTNYESMVVVVGSARLWSLCVREGQEKERRCQKFFGAVSLLAYISTCPKNRLKEVTAWLTSIALSNGLQP